MKKALLALVLAVPVSASAAGYVRVVGVSRLPMTPRILPCVPLPVVSIGRPVIQLPAPHFAHASLPLGLPPAVIPAPSAIEAVWVAQLPAQQPVRLPSPAPKSILPVTRRILKSTKMGGIELAALDMVFDNKGGKTPAPVAVPGEEIPVSNRIEPSGRPFTLPEHDLEDEIGLPRAVEAE